jgi:hypothetical protein
MGIGVILFIFVAVFSLPSATPEAEACGGQSTVE